RSSRNPPLACGDGLPNMWLPAPDILLDCSARISAARSAPTFSSRLIPVRAAEIDFPISLTLSEVSAVRPLFQGVAPLRYTRSWASLIARRDSGLLGFEWCLAEHR